MAVNHVTLDNFNDIKNSDKRVLLDFFATWCGPCQKVSPLVDEIAQEHPEYVVGKIDVDDEPELAAQFGVMSIPTLIVLDKGEMVDKAVGARSKNDILNMLKG